MTQTNYTILQAVMSPESDERINLGIILSDGQQSMFEISEKKLQILRLWKGEKAYQLMVRIADVLIHNEEQRNKLMQPSQHAYLRRYANNFVTVSPMHTIDAPMSATLTAILSQRHVE